MKSKVLCFDDKECLDILNQGKLLAMPTDTIYGVGCIYDSFDAFKRLVNLKKRPLEKPFSLVVPDKKDINKYAYTSNKVDKIIDKFLPGELTLILKAKKTYEWVSLNSLTIGIRVSGLDKVQELLKKINKPILLTSVNESSKPALNSFDDIINKFDGKIDGIIKYDGYQNSNVASTIISVVDDEIKLVRQGKIPFESILKVWEE